MNYENHPPLRKAGPPPMNGHHSSRSREEEQRRRLAGPATGLRAAQPLDIFADPPDMGRSGRPRRNSESSVADRKRILSPEEEKRRHERRRRDREAKHGPDGKLKPPSKKPNKQLDVIDKLDVSSIYGTGREYKSSLAPRAGRLTVTVFHHDGPFDACRPHRNRKGSNRAPMQAFPKDSINNTLGGAGPVNSNLDLAQFHGRGVEGFTDFSTSGKRNPAVDTNSFEPYAGAGAPNRPRPHGDRPGIDRTSSFNPGARVDPVHGDESLGLGTSTFLDGAPAPRNVIQRRESEGEQNNAGGLGRKKSLVQKIRGMNRERPSRRPMSPSSPGKSGSMRNSTPTSPLRGDDNPAVLSAGGMARVKEEGQSINPFFTTTTSPATANPSVTDYDDAYEQKGMRIKIAETEKLHRAREIEHARASDSAQAMRGITAGASGGHMESGTIATTGDKKMAAPSLERRVTTDVVSGPASGGLEKEEKPFGGGGFLSRVKSLKGGKRARPDRTLG